MPSVETTYVGVWGKRSLPPATEHVRDALGNGRLVFPLQHMSHTGCLEKNSGVGNTVIRCNYGWQAEMSSVYNKRRGCVPKWKTKSFKKKKTEETEEKW